MKSLLSCAVCAIAPALLVPALAFAQGAPNPPSDPGAPAAQPPSGGPTVSTPGAPPAGGPVPDQASSKLPVPQEEPAALIWRGTTFTWTHSATTTMVGIGRDNYDDSEDAYSWDFVLSPQLYVYDEPNDKIFLTAEAGVSVEWTDSGTTTTKHEPQFRDTQVGVGYQRNIFTSEDKEWSTKGTLRLRYSIPTSKFSLLQGRYGVISPSLSFTQVLRLLGNKADGLNNLTVVAGLTYSHLFSRASTPTNGGLERTRTNLGGNGFDSDQLSFRSFDLDRLIPSATFILPLYKDLSLTTAFRLISKWKATFSDTCVDTLTGCDEVERYGQAPARYLTDSTFDISLSQPIYDMFQLNIGYNNETLTLGEDGKARNVFYSPGAQFYLDIVANIDVIYEKASGRKNIDLPPGPRSTLTAVNEYGNPSF